MMFKMQALLSAVWGVGLILLALNGAGVVSARHNWHVQPTLYVFGDSFVDNGNIPRSGVVDGEAVRQWHYPYGLSYVNDDGSGAQSNPTPTGRFSDFMVQPDFIAQMMGLPQSPPTYQTTGGQYCDNSGMNFGFGPSGVNHISMWSNLREQVDKFKGMIKSGVISKDHVTNSVALIAISGNDYKSFGIHRIADLTAFTVNMTTEIAANVARLQNLGVKKVLVSNLHPLGCTPTQTKPNNYNACDKVGNLKTKLHNANLQHNLGSKKGVLILDMYTAFESIIGDDSSDGRFKKTREPCCVNNYPKGYCGQLDLFARPMYTVCNDPSEHFFWDDMHPTHAGWEAVTTKLEGHIKNFLGVA